MNDRRIMPHPMPFEIHERINLRNAGAGSARWVKLNGNVARNHMDAIIRNTLEASSMGRALSLLPITALAPDAMIENANEP